MSDAGVHEYFSDREQGPRPSTRDGLDERSWRGLVSFVLRLRNRGDFGHAFPEGCPDSYQIPIGTDFNAFDAALNAEVPTWCDWNRMPDTVTLCDFVEFCHRHIAKAIVVSGHAFYGHNHLRFDVAEGQAEFRAEVNLILQRNGIALHLEDEGQMRRLLDDPVGDAILRARFQTGDETLDLLLEEARIKFLRPDPRVRQEALERLWDGWERLKTVKDADKRQGATMLLDACAAEPALRNVLNDEARALTDLGNQFHIRHSETAQTEITDQDHVDYVFLRLFAFLLLILRKNDMLE